MSQSFIRPSKLVFFVCGSNKLYKSTTCKSSHNMHDD